MWIYLIFILFFILLCIRNQFWNRQPISHIYGFRSGLLLPFPLFNKYCDTLHVVETECTDEVIQYIQKKASYFKTDACIKSHLLNTFITIYVKSGIQGCLVSKKVNFSLCKDSYYHTEMYSDSHMHVLFQTHEYLRAIKTKCPVALFSSPKKIPLLKPVVHYSIQWIKSDTFCNYQLPKKIIRATSEMIYHDYYLWKHKFPCQVLPSLDEMMYMIQHKQLTIFYYDHAILFFKNTFELENNQTILDWIGTICLQPCSLKEAISALFYTFRKIYPVIRIHQLSDTPIYTGFKETYLNHYVYNFGIKKYNPHQCLFIV